jgi:hypothetical protein
MFAKNGTNDEVGLKFSGANRPKIIQNGVSHIENMWIKVKSIRTVTEMETFIWNGAKAEHMRGFNDDSLMAFFGCLYMFNFHFKQIKTASKLDESILRAWVSESKNSDDIPKMNNKQYSAWEKYMRTNRSFEQELLGHAKIKVKDDVVEANSEILKKYGMPFVSM